MYLKSIAFSVCLLLLSIVAFGQYHYLQKLSSFATIKLPDTPKVVESNGIKAFVSTYNNVIYVVNASDSESGLKDLFTSQNTDSIYSSFIKGALKLPKSKIIYRDKIKINGHEAVQFGYGAVAKGQQIYCYYRTVYVNDTLVTCGITASDLLPKDHPALTAFFDNFKLLSAKEIDEINSKNTNNKIGRVIGKLIVFSIPVAIGFAIIFLLKRIIYKKQKKQLP